MHVSRRVALTVPSLAVATTPLLPYSTTAAALAEERWPDIPFRSQFRDLVQTGLDDYRPNDHLRFLAPYTSTGPYLNYGHVTWSGSAGSYRFDAEGVPQTLYGDTYYDHPVTFCRYGLHLHDRITKGEDDLRPLFFRVVNRLIATQSVDGGFRYPFPYRVYGHQFEAGWASAMAQGMGLSLLRRADDLQRDSGFTRAGNKAVVFLTRSIDTGGVQTTLADLEPSLTDYIWLEEFATRPANYKLNGFLFTLLGLYDWWQRAPNRTEGSKTVIAGDLFHRGAQSAALSLPYFDLRGFTTPDCRYMFIPSVTPRIQPGYHRVHIYQLHALAQITEPPWASTFASYEKLWRWQVGDVS